MSDNRESKEYPVVKINLTRDDLRLLTEGKIIAFFGGSIQIVVK